MPPLQMDGSTFFLLGMSTCVTFPKFVFDFFESLVYTVRTVVWVSPQSDSTRWQLFMLKSCHLEWGLTSHDTCASTVSSTACRASGSRKSATAIL